MVLCKRKLFQHVTSNNVKHLHQISLKMYQNIYGVAFQFLKKEGPRLVTQFPLGNIHVLRKQVFGFSPKALR